MSLYPSDSLTSNTRLSARNFAATELVADITIAQTQFTVKDATQYPSLAAGEFFIAVISHANDATKKEVVKVTAVSSATWTVQRGYEGSSSFAFPAKSSIECRLTAGTLGLIRGFTTKRISGGTQEAYPFHEYFANAPTTFNMTLANFADGQRARFRVLDAAANQRVYIQSNSTIFFVLDGSNSWCEVMRVGSEFRVTAAGNDTFDDFYNVTSGMTVKPYLSYRAVYSGSTMVVNLPSGAALKARFPIKFEGFDGSQGKLGEVRLGTGEVFDVPFTSSVFLVDRPMVLVFQRIASNRWSIVDGSVFGGNYNALEKRVDALEIAKFTKIGSSGAPAFASGIAGHVWYQFTHENVIQVIGHADGTINGSTTLFTFPVEIASRILREQYSPACLRMSTGTIANTEALTRVRTDGSFAAYENVSTGVADQVIINHTFILDEA